MADTAKRRGGGLGKIRVAVAGLGNCASSLIGYQGRRLVHAL